MNLRLALSLSAVWAVSALAAAPGQDLPTTPKHPVTETYHGVAVTDDYRWLEDASDPAVKAWSAAQNAHTRAYLDALPSRALLQQRITRILTTSSPIYLDLRHRPGLLFALEFLPTKQQPILVTRTGPDDTASEKVVLDPNVLNAAGTTAIDFYAPSQDGKYVAVSLSEYGSEDGAVAVYETATGKRLAESVPRVNFATAGGSVAWNGDGTGFWYTRYPQGTERAAADANFFQEIYFHALGTPATQDTYALGHDFPRIAETELTTSEDGRYTLAVVKNGDGGQEAHYVRSPDGKWTQITKFTDRIQDAAIGPDDALYLLSRQDALRGKLLRLPLDKPRLKNARVIVPEGDEAIQDFTPTATKLYVSYLNGGPSVLREFDHEGKALGEIPTEPVSTLGRVVRLEGDRVLYYVESYVTPPAWYAYDPATNKAVKTALAVTAPVDFSDVVVRRAFATSKDGTKIPVNILSRRDTPMDGSNPTLLTAYGGYGVNTTPAFNPLLRVWLDAGGVFAEANVRGGGEYGDAWHLAGNLTHKQNVFDDFLACAQFLVDQHYTRPDRLAIQGGSNGGLLMGAALTQRPDLFRAVVSHVGIYDMLRVELDPNGAFNVTEFGTVRDPDQFRALYAYSPYHHVVDGTKYPAVLFMTGDNDGRVNPMNSRKMTARLQAANASPYPILLRTTAKAGHGIGSSLDEVISGEADADAFLFDQLGMTLPPIHQ